MYMYKHMTRLWWYCWPVAHFQTNLLGHCPSAGIPELSAPDVMDIA